MYLIINYIEYIDYIEYINYILFLYKNIKNLIYCTINIFLVLIVSKFLKNTYFDKNLSFFLRSF